MGTEGGANKDSTRLLIEEFTSKFTSSLSQILAQNNQLIAQNNPPSNKPPAILSPLENPNSHIAIKFTGKNYRICSQVAEMHIASKEKLGHIDGTTKQPEINAPEYKRWKTDDVVAKSWLINSLVEPLIGDFIRYPTAKEEQKKLLKCTNPKCLGSGHTKEMCFKIVGYPEWWLDMQRKKKGRGAVGNFAYQQPVETGQQYIPRDPASAPAATDTTMHQIASSSAHLSLMPSSSGEGEGCSFEGDYWAW